MNIYNLAKLIINSVMKLDVYRVPLPYYNFNFNFVFQNHFLCIYLQLIYLFQTKIHAATDKYLIIYIIDLIFLLVNTIIF